jgi:dienelactone hydrolase
MMRAMSRAFPRLPAIFRLRLLRVVALVAAIAAFAGPLRAGEADFGEDTDNPIVVAFLRDLPAPTTVEFPWRPGRFNQFQIGAEEENFATERRGRLAAKLYPAPRPGPRPYAVLLSGCGGTYEGVNGLWLRLWARALRDIGMGALALDSFDVRGVPDGVCGENSKTWTQRRVDDAHSALAWLSDQPFVDARRIVVMGMSNGARTALLSVSSRESWRFRQFAAAIGLYPLCDRMPPHGLLAPSLLLLGEADKPASIRDCTAFVRDRAATAIVPQAKSYPLAAHLFDAFPRNEDFTLPEVVDSRAETLAFLRRVLGLTQPTGPQAGSEGELSSSH